jgi:guanylate kinase
MTTTQTQSLKRGRLFVVSGPSGVGKGTLVARVAKEIPDEVWVSISATTRPPREGDAEGVTYFFKTHEQFRDMIDNDGLLEWAEYAGNFYGTPRQSVEDALAAGKSVILEIEVQGAFQVREKMPEARLVFIEPPSLDELRRRLTGRATDSPEQLEKRLATAKVELSRKMDYDICLVNDNLKTATEALINIIQSQD